MLFTSPWVCVAYLFCFRSFIYLFYLSSFCAQYCPYLWIVSSILSNLYIIVLYYMGNQIFSLFFQRFVDISLPWHQHRIYCKQIIKLNKEFLKYVKIKTLFNATTFVVLNKQQGNIMRQIHPWFYVVHFCL